MFDMFTVKKVRLAAALALLASPVASRALAQGAMTSAVSVAAGDLDLASPQGRAMLRHRLDIAARQLCDLPSTGSLSGSDRAECYDPTLETTRKQMGRLIAAAQRGTEVAQAGK